MVYRALICSQCLLFILGGGIRAAATANGGSGWSDYKESSSSFREPPLANNYEIVVPTRVSANGDFISYALPQFYKTYIVPEDSSGPGGGASSNGNAGKHIKGQMHHRRGCDCSKTDHRRCKDAVHYKVPIEGEQQLLQLTPNRALFTAAGLIIESFFANAAAAGAMPASRAGPRSRIERARDKQCHYRGCVKGDPGSKAAISTCNGLSGYIRTKRGYYVIEPATNRFAERGLNEEVNVGMEQPHFLYQNPRNPHREDSSPEEESEDRDNEEEAAVDLDGLDKSSNCDTGGNVATIMARRARRERRQQFLGSGPLVAPYGFGFVGQNTGESSEVWSRAATPNADEELHIETMVVVDKSLLKYHKDLDVENYVLTVFNMAHDLYHDESMNMNINLAIVRMIRLEDEKHEMNAAVTKNAEKTLEYFKHWQKAMNPGDDAHPNHHDVAILLTRVDICDNKDSCGILGRARMGGMCDPDNAAAIAQDSGLLLGFVIAHEIAHTLGVPHDKPDESGCNDTVAGGFKTVMTDDIDMKSTEWSTCSGKYIKMFIESGFGKCLYDPPTDHSFTLVDILPGVMYGGDFQCKELFGPTAIVCDTGVECKNLMCFVPDKGCVETHMPPAAGTNCGEKKWCYELECVEVGERPEGAIDGGWGEWGPWTPCTRSCGSGVSSSERHCTSPRPAKGGKYCSGSNKRHKICSTEPCDVTLPSFRDTQCAEFNEWVYPEDGKTHHWKAYRMPDENPCILFCANDEGAVASLRPRVVDGTTCLHGIRDICINGLCKEIPCDLNLESTAVEDWCGICHGDGTQCNVKEGLSEVKPPAGGDADDKVQILDIPKGARNIRVEETQPSESKIQVRSCDSKIVYIKGSQMGMFSVPGSKAWIGMIRNKQEALHIPGPVEQRLKVWIIAKEKVSIQWSMGVPLNCTEKRKPVFDWDYLEFKPCSAQCGPGTRNSVPRCKEKIAGLVDDEYCANITKPPERIQPCENAPCRTRWMIGDWQECDCAKKKKTRMVNCIKPSGDGEGEAVIIEESACQGDKPKNTDQCACRNARLSHGYHNKDVYMTGKQQDRKHVKKLYEDLSDNLEPNDVNPNNEEDSLSDSEGSDKASKPNRFSKIRRQLCGNDTNSSKILRNMTVVDAEKPESISFSLHALPEEPNKCKEEPKCPNEPKADAGGCDGAPGKEPRPGSNPNEEDEEEAQTETAIRPGDGNVVNITGVDALKLMNTEQKNNPDNKKI